MAASTRLQPRLPPCLCRRGPGRGAPGPAQPWRSSDHGRVATLVPSARLEHRTTRGDQRALHARARRSGVRCAPRAPFEPPRRATRRRTRRWLARQPPSARPSAGWPRHAGRRRPHAVCRLAHGSRRGTGARPGTRDHDVPPSRHPGGDRRDRGWRTCARAQRDLARGLGCRSRVKRRHGPAGLRDRPLRARADHRHRRGGPARLRAPRPACHGEASAGRRRRRVRP